MPEFGKRHPVLLRFQMKVLGIAFAAILALTGVGWYQQQSAVQTQQQAAAEADVRADFYRIIAGQESPGDSGVKTRLAEDLRELLGETNPSATSLPKTVEDFDIATSNRYRGISDELGVDPFASASTCTECGQLSAEFKAKLLQIKKGQVEALISSEAVTVDTSLHLTPFGVSGLSELGLIWLLGGPLSLALAHRWANARENDYQLRRFGDLDWKLDGTCDGTKMTLMALSPSFFAPYLIWRKHQRREFEKQVEEKFPTETEILKSVQRMLDRLGLGSGDSRAHLEAEELVRYLRRELESRTRAGEDARLDAHYQRIVSELEQVGDALQSRDVSMAELDSLGLGEVSSAPQERPELRRQQGTS